MNSVQRCSVCLSDYVRREFDFAGYRICRCGQCSHLFVCEVIATEELNQAYDESYYVAPAGGEERKGYDDYLAQAPRKLAGFTAWYRELEKIVGGPGRSLDFGCAVGLMVKAAQDCGWEATGYDRSEWAVQYGRTNFGVNLVCGDGSVDSFPAGGFDLITLWDVLEHVAQPREVLTLAHRWLRPGGWLVLNTVNSSSLGARLAGMHWRHLGPPRHLQYFTARSLKYLVKDTGFTVERSKGNGVFLEAKRRDHPLGTLASSLESVITHWRARKLADLLSLRDEIELCTRKN